ncbi:MAG TPA: nucleotidyltransferase family protein [Acidobacteriaceae bacterium]|nr:nucleotidyltransferase family protein [Acidobacteriaceae bacterium]
MKPGIDLLLDLLRGRIDPYRCSEAEWLAALALADDEHVLPWAAAQLQSHAAALPAAVAARIAESSRESALAAFYWTAELTSTLHAFAESGIPVVLLKGPSLAERIYGSAALRPSRDLDLLVSRADWSRAEAALATLGFAPVREADDYHRPWQRNTTKLELHHDVEDTRAFDFSIATTLAQAQPAHFHGGPCLLLAPEDELLYLCLHAARHRYERLSFVLDLRLAFTRLADPQRWRPRTETAHLAGLIVLGLVMARRLDPALCDGWNPGASEREWRHLELVANALWLRLRTEPFQRRDWSRAHSFYLSLEPTAPRRLRRRLRDVRILATRIIDRDRIFAARLGLTRDWQVRLLRPVRLLLERAQRRRSVS